MSKRPFLPRPLLLAVALLLAGPALAAEAVTPVHQLAPAAQLERARADAQAVARYRQGLADTVAHLASRPDLFSADTLPSAEARESLRAAWQRYLDYALALDTVASYHKDFYRLPLGASRQRSLELLQAAYVAQYRQALDLIAVLERNPRLHLLLNEPLEGLGLPAGTYSGFKYRFLNVVRGSEFATLDLLARGRRQRPLLTTLAPGVEEDRRQLWSYGKHEGPPLTLRNAVKVVGDTGFAAFFPVQAGVAEWMGDTKVYRVQRSLVSPEQIAALRPRLQPGDILLERREWYLSNAGLPGFWPHAALYVGSAEERRALADDPQVRDWVKSQGMADGELESLLARRFPEAHALSGQPVAGGPARVLEAISEGVTFTSLEHSADADSVAVLRPRLSALEKAQALVRAFGYVGRPYDFNFDFVTDSALVCSELIYKAYQPGPDYNGLELPLGEVAGRLVMSPNDLAALHASTAGSPEAPFEWVAFLDGSERQGRALERDEAAFMESWQRPKWHVLLQ